MKNSRRQFIRKCGFATTASLLPSINWSSTSIYKTQDIEAIAPELVKEFVRVAHFDFEETKKMLEKTPHLINATQDWGDGDFESAIGAAGHMGFKDLANHLISKGARFDIFVLTMLGKTDTVKPWLESYPHLLNSIGPHGFTLLHHANKGGKDAEDLYDYLQRKGLFRNIHFHI